MTDMQQGALGLGVLVFCGIGCANAYGLEFS